MQQHTCSSSSSSSSSQDMGNRVDDDENKAEALSNSNLSAFTNWQIRV
jgi:hypothetical protein